MKKVTIKDTGFWRGTELAKWQGAEVVLGEFLSTGDSGGEFWSAKDEDGEEVILYHDVDTDVWSVSTANFFGVTAEELKDGVMEEDK